MAVVLVVDDEVGIANLLSDVLSDEGHRVLVAVNGHEAFCPPSAPLRQWAVFA